MTKQTKKKVVKKDNIFKAKIIVILKSGEVVYGDGTVEGVRAVSGEALLTARFYKSLTNSNGIR
jgi:hypothetical protein